MSFIQSIGTATPVHRFTQETLQEAVSQHHSGISKDRITTIFQSSAIKYRHSVLSDLEDLSNQIAHTSIVEKMKIYKKEALPLALSAVSALNQNISSCTHLITVSCTGLSAPGLDFHLIQALGLKETTQRLSVNFMGCFASFHALKMANHICASEKNAQVLLVSVELCTLHIQTGNELDLVVSNAIFADGAAAAWITNEAKGLEIRHVFQDIVPESTASMSWDLGINKFDMKLGHKVPDQLSGYLKKMIPFVQSENIAHHALHPGGRKIIEKYIETLGLVPENLSATFNTLSNYGNMSSATILFVLKEMLNKQPKGNILAMGFGPGLTVEGLILKNTLEEKKSSFSFKNRSTVPELLDSDTIPKAELFINLEELAYINKQLGGHAITIKGIKQLIKNNPKPKYTLLDVGCGGGDSMYEIHLWAKKNGLNIQCIGLDLLLDAIEYCKNKYAHISELTFICGDIHNYHTKTDLLMCNLVCHHLYNDFLDNVLLKFRDLSIIGFVINDLERNPIAYWSIKWLTALFSKSHLVQNDAALSVAKGFRKKEWASMFHRLKINNSKITWQWAFRHLIVYKK